MFFEDLEALKYAGNAYVVGGSVRDLILNRNPKDIDIAVSQEAEALARRVADMKRGNLVILGKRGQVLYRVITSDRCYDITPLNGESIEEDLQQRDFTINAMAFELQRQEIIDCQRGRDDIQTNTLRMVSDAVFQQDPVRLLRAFRIAAELGFSIEANTLAAIRQHARLIIQPAAERIWVEFLRLMESAVSGRYLSQMAETGLLFALLPEMQALAGCEQNGRHQYDVFKHTLMAYQKMETLLNDADTCALFFQDHAEKQAEIKKRLLKYAILLHDLGKPATKTLDESGRIHFYGHDLAGAELALRIAERLRLSNFEKEFTDGLIRNHIRPLLLYMAHARNSLSIKGVIRFFINAGAQTPYILLHAMADHLGKSHGEQAETASYYEFLAGLTREYHARFKVIRANPPLITGRDLVAEFQLKPSPIFSKIIMLVEEARLAREICNRPAALAFVRDYLKNTAS